jgi:hypothetical protein
MKIGTCGSSGASGSSGTKISKDQSIYPGEEICVYLTTKTGENSQESIPIRIRHRKDGMFTIYCDFFIDHRPLTGSNYEEPKFLAKGSYFELENDPSITIAMVDASLLKEKEL